MLVIAGVNAVTFVTDPSYVNDVAVVAVAPSDVDFDVVAAAVDVGVTVVTAVVFNVNDVVSTDALMLIVLLMLMLLQLLLTCSKGMFGQISAPQTIQK